MPMMFLSRVGSALPPSSTVKSMYRGIIFCRNQEKSRPIFPVPFSPAGETRRASDRQPALLGVSHVQFECSVLAPCCMQTYTCRAVLEAVLACVSSYILPPPAPPNFRLFDAMYFCCGGGNSAEATGSSCACARDVFRASGTRS